MKQAGISFYASHKNDSMNNKISTSIQGITNNENGSRVMYQVQNIARGKDGTGIICETTILDGIAILIPEPNLRGIADLPRRGREPWRNPGD